jgi:glycosyltransferase involved in cell wall biosynthesis
VQTGGKRVKKMSEAPIKVLHIIDHLGLGGAQTFLLDLAVSQHLSRLTTPEICCLTEPTCLSQRLGESGVPVTHLCVGRRNPLEIAGTLFRLVGLIRDQEYDLVHTHLFVSGVFGRLAATVLGLPTVAHEQCNEREVVGAFRRWIDFFLGARTSAIVCVSETTKDYNVRVKGIDQARIWVIPNSIDPKRLSGCDGAGDRAELLGALGLPDEVQIVIGIGRLEQQKRFDIFLRAAELISAHMPKARFLIVGDGSKRRELEELARKLGVSSVVRFTGMRADVPMLLGISDIFVLTSDFEGLPLTLLEALTMEVPVVGTDVDGTSEVLGNGVGGILVPPRDPEAVAEAVQSLLNDPERRRVLAKRGHQLVEQTYSAEIVRRQIDEVYRTVLRQER